ncbi:hypothetical protein M378DRAFT_156640 [Amanita muscaria Koide BX008]|uniref:Uncharacterized protein n=1 Tax=Amanita muscaria (strain Koide BX008) TaxID=946122 RepID=A0A0C2XLU2_AMAMK|nr:hypothetical protein M378DRAFT_156640 [Amanita muscaria Koide BX008]
MEPNLKATLMKLLDALESIQTLVEKCAARSTIKAVLHVFDIDEISEFNEQRRKLEQCGFLSLLDLQERTNQLVEHHGTNGGVSSTTTNKGRNRIS